MNLNIKKNTEGKLLLFTCIQQTILNKFAVHQELLWHKLLRQLIGLVFLSQRAFWFKGSNALIYFLKLEMKYVEHV